MISPGQTTRPSLPARRGRSTNCTKEQCASAFEARISITTHVRRSDEQKIAEYFATEFQADDLPILPTNFNVASTLA